MFSIQDIERMSTNEINALVSECKTELEKRSSARRNELIQAVCDTMNLLHKEFPMVELRMGHQCPECALDDDFDDPSVRYSSSAKVPFRCMFVRDQKVVDGQRVTVRLLEDYSVDGVFVPANTHLAAMCKVSDRLELSVRSVEMNGRILPLQLVAYDTDGMAGIYSPETSASRNSRRASSDAISAANSTFGGLVGDLANTVLRTGATIAKSASGELSVKIVSGYEFYLVKSER